MTVTKPEPQVQEVSPEDSGGSSTCTVVDTAAASEMRSKFESKVTEEFSSVQTTATTYTKETHVQEVVGVVSKITQKIDRLESTIDDLVKKLSRPPTDGSSRSSNITVSDFEISESETIRTETSETTSVTDQAKKWVEAEKKSYKEDFIEKVIKIGEDLKKRVKPDRYIPRVKQQCDRYGTASITFNMLACLTFADHLSLYIGIEA